MFRKTFYLVIVTCFSMAMLPALAQAQEANKATLPSGQMNLSSSVLVLAPGMTGPELKAADMLLDEVEKRSWVRWPITKILPKSGKGIVLGQRTSLIKSFPALAGKLKATGAEKAEGYRIVTLESGLVIVAGNDARGVLFGAGKLLQMMDYSRNMVSLAEKIDLSTSPKYKLRGHQLGYRPKTNTNDGMSAAMWEQYIRDLVIFGTNAIELIPPISDDALDSPHFPLDPQKMMIEMSRLCKEYGIECWVWYPAMAPNYADPVTLNRELKEWGDVLRQLPRVDAVFVPGGDPGHTAPKVFFPMLEKQTAQLKKLHPGATMWMSPQGFNEEWMNDFFSIMNTQPTWLEGIVFGPQQRISLQELRAKVPKRYKMRFYPDITHSLGAQYPVPDWDFAYATTLQREPINPRPMDEAAIFKSVQPYAEYGFLTYSEGLNDDVNKIIWSGLGWDPNTNVADILREYGRYFIGTKVGDAFGKGLMNLEQNWRGLLEENQGVQTTLAQFQELEKNATPQMLQNWRFQEGLYRAYYDATDRTRLLYELGQEKKAMEALSQAKTTGSAAAIKSAEAALAKPDLSPWSDTRARVFELAEALFQSTHMQLSVAKYQAIAIGRGANLDLIDSPFNNAAWLRKRFAEIAALSNESDRVRKIDELLNWANPGPGGFYDDLGRPGSQPHLVTGTAYNDDPAFLKAPYSGVGARLQPRISSSTFSATLFDHPLEMFYPNLDKNARYRVKIIYGTEAASGVRLTANDKFEIKAMGPKPMDNLPVEYDIPAEATSGGTLRLKWERPAGSGGSGRGLQVAEVWLMRIP